MLSEKHFERRNAMVNNDTIKLLKECNAGVKTAVTAIDEVLDKVESKSLERILAKNKEEHEELGNLTHTLLNRYDKNEKDPSPMAKAMTKMMTEAKLMVNSSDEKVADMMYDGCNMGVKSLYRYLNQYSNADEEAKEIAGRLIYLENGLMQKLRAFL